MYKLSEQKNLILSGLLIAIGLVIPAIFHSYGINGSIYLPMHIPVLLCGLICGWRYGLIVGLLVPLLNSLLAGMPPLFPVAVAMAFELATYGLVAGLVSSRLSGNRYQIIGSLIIAMMAGRVVLGIANSILLGVAGNAYSFEAFISGAFITALPGIIIQLVVIPIILAALEKASLLEKKWK